MTINKKNIFGENMEYLTTCFLKECYWKVRISIKNPLQKIIDSYIRTLFYNSHNKLKIIKYRNI